MYLLDWVLENYLLTNIEYGEIAMLVAGDGAVLTVPYLDAGEDIIEGAPVESGGTNYICYVTDNGFIVAHF